MIDGPPRAVNEEPIEAVGQHREVARAASGMGLAAAASRAIGGVRMAVIAAVLGTTYLGNAFQSANSVSNVLFELLAAGALSAVLVPTFVGLLAADDDEQAEELAGGLLTVAFVVLGTVALLGVVAAPWIAQILTAGVDPDVVDQQRDLVEFLLRFFLPQVVLYAIGALSTAVLNAKGSFALPTAAPIGNTVVLVLTMVGFAHLAGPNPGLDLPNSARWTLGIGGTLGVLAFVAIPYLSLRRQGFRMRFRGLEVIRSAAIRRLVGLVSWSALQHAGQGLLLGAAIVAAGGIAGGVVAYQYAMVVFLAPYGILAQPIHTAVLPRLATQAASNDLGELRKTAGWALTAMGMVTLPVAAGLTALASPIMRVLAFGDAGANDGARLLAASLVGLAVGVPVYGIFLLLSRVSYALGDSRSPALRSIVSGVLGGGLMLTASQIVDGPQRLLAIAGVHSLTYLVAAAWMGVKLRRHLGAFNVSRLWYPAVVSAGLGLTLWLGTRIWIPGSRWIALAQVLLLSAVGGILYLVAVGGPKKMVMS